MISILYFITRPVVLKFINKVPFKIYKVIKLRTNNFKI